MTRARNGGRSLQQLSTVALAVAIAAIVLGAVIVWAGFNSVIEARARLFDTLQPARLAAQELRTSAVDQETGLRGYAITSDDRLLQPYDRGRDNQDEADRRLRRLVRDDLAGPLVAARLDRVETAMDDWRDTVAAPVLEGRLDRRDLDGVFIRSTALFDDARAELDRLDATIDGEATEARGELDAATVRLVISIGVAVGLFGAVALGGSWVLRRRVVAPIDQLVVAADAVAAGRFDEPIEVTGPAEIELLALRVSDMRSRIVGELAQVEAARVELAQRAAELSRSNADLEQFAYVASHDLQEPLRKVASFCQLLEQRYGDQLDDRGRSYIDFAVDGAKRMQALIADLLDFSRLGRTTQAFVECDLDAIAHEVLHGFAAELDGATVSVEGLPTVPGDPTLYRALLQNLVGNAIKYRVAGQPPTIALSAALSGDTWTFRCADRGIGIEAPYRERVFAVFQRLHGRDEYEGTGIGLALCRRIVEFSGGRIWIDEPADGVGTTVCWTIPATRPSESTDGNGAVPDTSDTSDTPDLSAGAGRAPSSPSLLPVLPRTPSGSR